MSPPLWGWGGLCANATPIRPLRLSQERFPYRRLATRDHETCIKETSQVGVSPEQRSQPWAALRAALFPSRLSSHLGNGDPYLYPDEIKSAKDLVHGRLQAPVGLFPICKGRERWPGPVPSGTEASGLTEVRPLGQCLYAESVRGDLSQPQN